MSTGLENAGIDRWARAVVSGCEAALRGGEQGSGERDLILEALASVEALGAALELVGSDALRTLRERPALRSLWGSLSARARLLLGPTAAAAAASGDAALGARRADRLARAGLARLEAKAPAALPESLTETTSRSRVPEESLLRLIRGELDGFRAAELSWQLRRDAEGAAELRLLLGLDPLREPLRERAGDAGLLRLAAEGPSALRDPASGTVVGRAPAGQQKAGQSKSGKQKTGTQKTAKQEHNIALEAVRFPDGVVAIYASHPVALGLAPSQSVRGKKAASAARGSVVLGSAPGYLELRARADGPLGLTVDGREVVLDLGTLERT